ncbi:MAG: GyrI-like domain-containing protein [Dehalococcoidia bacterium]|nr:GyrI-like domain-containing protein [Dehalococcoidia bacterium]
MKVEIINFKAQIAVAMKVTAIGMDKMAEEMDAGYKKLMVYVSEQGKQIAGAPYCCYTNCSEDFSQFDMELAIPVNEALSISGDFFMSQSYDGRAVTATHKGAYKDVEIAYTALMQYMAENKLESTGVYYDYYINNPADTQESELLTQVVFPIK